jgi:hypothetical protein
MKKFLKGFSIAEVVMAAFLMSLAFVGLLQLHISSLSIAGRSKEYSTATRDAASMMEKIGTVPFSSVVTQFPNGCCVGVAGACGVAPTCPGASDMVITTEMILNNENIKVSYPAGTVGDPLGISVTASWIDGNGRQHCNGCSAPPVVLSTISTMTCTQ